MKRSSTLTIAAAAVAVAAIGVPAIALARGGAPDPVRPNPAFTATAATAARPSDELVALRARVEAVPGDWPAWDALGSLELERGRATGDPAAYAAADRAFETSLRLAPDGNDGALAGRAALAAARHDFADAERQARQALAVNPSAPEALAALTDALTELGRYDDALAAAEQLDGIRPGVASFTRLAYQAELRGELPRAIDLMRRAADDAQTPAQVAFARSHEGLLALERRDVAAADRAFRAGSAAAPDDAAVMHLGARIATAAGRTDLAVARYADLVARRPTVTYAAEYAAALTAAGRAGEAAQALELARAAQQLATDAGVAPDASDIVFEADHGDPARAVQLAQELWQRSPSVASADAFGWALHKAGRSKEALAFADRALALGGKPAQFVAHRQAIATAIGSGR
jgi:tetratricopeptide (TPR) repeat protein